MRIKQTDAARTRSLRRFLAFDTNTVVSVLAEDELEVGFVGSLNALAQQQASEQRLRAWLAAHPDAIAVICP